MAEGRHFENSFISISQSELSDFEQIWYADANFHSEDGYLTKKSIFFKFKMGTDAIFKIIFWLYLGALLADRREIRKGDEESHANTDNVTKTVIFPNSRWQKAAILKSFRCLGHSYNEVMLSIVFQ